MRTICVDEAETLSDKEIENKPHITVNTFGMFDVFVDGELVLFSRSKSKDLLAYLVDRRGGSCKRSEVFSVLWENRTYDRSMQKQLDVIIRSMRDTLRSYRIEEMFELKRGASMGASRSLFM